MTPMSSVDQVREQILTLQTQLLTAHPQLPVLLSIIHKQLIADPEIITLVSEEECGITVSGLKRQTQTEVSVKALSSSKKGGLKALGIGDL